MLRRVAYYVVIFVTLVSWPLSLLVNPPDWKRESIFYRDSMEELVHDQRLALSYSQTKRVFYNKYTVYKDRYVKNFLYSLDLNNYFFQAHPREDVSGISYRPKFPFFAVIVLAVAISTIRRNQKNYLWVGIWFLVGLVLIPLLKNTDGFDFYFYFPLSYLLIVGYSKIYELRYGADVIGLCACLGLVEIFRII